MRLFVGMTTWNSAAFLPASLAALRAMTDARETHLVVFDNDSTDGAAGIARRFGADIFYTRRDELC
jgi:glycosyltransferase involved in cell wall biosynthesis